MPLAQEVKYKFILYISSLSVNKNIIFVLNKNYSKCIKWVNFGTFSKNNILKLTMWSLNASLANYFLYSINWLILASCNLFVSKKIKQIMLIFNKMWPKKKTKNKKLKAIECDTSHKGHIFVKEIPSRLHNNSKL